MGLSVDSSVCKTFLPADRKEFIQQTVNGMLSAHPYTNRQPASVVMSVSPAVIMAPLYIRKLYQSMGENMDSQADNMVLAGEDLYWYDNMELCDGKSWLKRTSFIHVCGDAFKVGCGGYTPNGELQHAIVLSLVPEEMLLMSANKVWSDLHEVKHIALLLKQLCTSQELTR